MHFATANGLVTVRRRLPAVFIFSPGQMHTPGTIIK